MMAAEQQKKEVVKLRAIVIYINLHKTLATLLKARKESLVVTNLPIRYNWARFFTH